MGGELEPIRMSGFLAIFGEAPPVHVVERKVSIWSYTRCPEAFRAALASSSELESCRRELQMAGYVPDLAINEGGLAKIFVTPQDARLIQHMHRNGSLELRASDVIVGTEYEECVRTVTC